ncbi:MAG: restriction endonuclease subunit S [Bacteroidota bacterium]
MVAEGYKNTEIGVIPKDWDVKSLGSLFEITSSKRVFQSEWKKSGIPFYRARELAILSEKGVVVNDLYIDIKQYQLYKKQFGVPVVGDMLVTGVGTLGKVYVIQSNREFYFKDGNIIWFKIKEAINSEFLKQLFSTVLVTKQIDDASGKTTVGTYTINGAKHTSIPFPPKPEQNAIATALSDADALISATEKLIAKKKAIKKGAMQELLKPKEGWEEKTLEEDFDIIKGQGLSKSKLDEHGKLECILYGELFTTYKELIREVNSKTNSEEGIMSKFGDILFPGSTTTVGIDLAKCSTILANNVMIGGDIIVLRKKQKHINPEFIVYYLNIKCKYKIAAKTKGVTIYHLHGKDLSDIKISYPDYQEQTRIATILSDMDAEISLLEQKLEKQKQIKQGMMQSLLTGKIRLLENADKQVKKPKHNEQINEAVVISFLVHKFGTEKYPLSRFRYTKYAYLLHRQSEREARGFDKHAAGPYNPANRYKGAEDIAVKNKYITKVQNPTSQNDAFVVNENIEGALNYFQEWYGTEIQQWIEQFKFYKNEYLEVLTTVDKAICELAQKRNTIDVQNIKVYIDSIPQWKKKLEKPYFSDIEIQRAIDESNKLFGNG